MSDVKAVETEEKKADEAPAEQAPESPAETTPEEKPAEEPGAEEPEVVPTALNPDTWPAKTGTVTDPEILARHGLGVTTGSTATVTVQSPPQPVPKQPSAQHELFDCLVRQLPSGHPSFWSDAHLKGERLACPVCDSVTVLRVEQPATA